MVRGRTLTATAAAADADTDADATTAALARRCAASGGHAAAASKLIEHGANVDITTVAGGESSLMYAARGPRHVARRHGSRACQELVRRAL